MGTLTRSHKIRLYPTKEQEQWLRMVAGSARHAYNQMLDKAITDYREYKEHGGAKPSTSFYSIRDDFKAHRDSLMPWWRDVPERAYSNEAAHLSRAFTNFYRRLRTGGNPGFPRFKRRGNDSFTLDRFTLNDDQIITLQGKRIRLAEPFRFTPERFHVGCTITTRGGEWFVSITCDITDPGLIADTNDTIGVDVNLAEYVTSDGERFPVPKAYRTHKKRLRRLQKSMARKTKGSHNRSKVVKQLGRLNMRIADERNDWIHKLSSYLTGRYSEIHLEDLNVAGMMRNHHLALGIADAAFSEFRRQVTYKSEARHSKLVIVDRWFPSSKLCHNCGVRNENLQLSQRSWSCGACGTRLDRDLNAALNIRDYGVIPYSESLTTEGSSGCQACGEAVVDASLKQESNVLA